ncbi:hypothetical protein [Spirosoma aerolatum]|uniref:hypothetical protein n=1 Tax=Spirosoma aerolatum TaxID=1211326 RepID=UPI0009AC5284|nr:hypothetical protein [Spirosoma aerolatum]
MNANLIRKAIVSSWLLGLFSIVCFVNCTQGDSADRGELVVYDREASTELDVVSQWRRILSGTRLNYFHTYRSYSGGFTRVIKMDLCPGGYYNYYGQASFDNQGPVTETGTWGVQEASGQVQLVLTPEGQQTTYSNLALNEKQNVLLWNKEFIPARTGKYGPSCQ